jgi:hypothetical protein
LEKQVEGQLSQADFVAIPQLMSLMWLQARPIEISTVTAAQIPQEQLFAPAVNRCVATADSIALRFEGGQVNLILTAPSKNQRVFLLNTKDKREATPDNLNAQEGVGIKDTRSLPGSLALIFCNILRVDLCLVNQRWPSLICRWLGLIVDFVRRMEYQRRFFVGSQRYPTALAVQRQGLIMLPTGRTLNRISTSSRFSFHAASPELIVHVYYKSPLYVLM